MVRSGLFSSADVGVGRFLDKSSRFLTEAKAAALGCTFLAPGDVLISRMADPIGRACIFPGASQRCVTVVDVCVVRPEKGRADPRWLTSALNSPAFRRTVEVAASGTTRSRVSRGNLGMLTLPVPPLAEQRRIVAKLEALQARSRRAREALDAVPPLLEKLRQFILAAAFRGDLTKNWRAKHPDVEPASELLKRIRVERRKKWEEAELAKMMSKGKAPGDDRWKGKYKEPEAVDTVGLPGLPEGWGWASADLAVRAPIAYGVVQPGPECSEGVPFVRAMDMDNDSILADQVRHISGDIASAYPRTRLELGDVLVGIVRAAKVATVPAALVGGNIVRGIARLAPCAAVVPEYLAAWFASPDAQNRLLAKHRGIDMPVINLGDVRALPVPLAPIAEQVTIARRIEELRRSVKITVRLGHEVTQRVSSLEAACLAKAFRGELVPQDPNDEPAEVMLARVRGANATTTTGATSRPGKKPASPGHRTRDA